MWRELTRMPIRFWLVQILGFEPSASGPIGPESERNGCWTARERNVNESKWSFSPCEIYQETGDNSEGRNSKVVSTPMEIGSSIRAALSKR
jgi:hypothetical protein